ncbi:uncharacterized protein PAC_04366 [Phialocephala subalpina]|uniref:Amino acid permease/ SLC12A domain-containing protein n=1 Tax=Phialocephala subalpina TaxID=576137 RepID=A0A1L7WNZ1_9HELO|nr:uncharacterized protein PAC_04366 [Phialocephala subalpina]
MATQGGKLFEEKGTYDTASRESPVNQEIGLLEDPAAVQYGDTQNDIADMQRLGKNVVECWFHECTIVASLAEMESMAPTSGGQYHWVSEFAPAKYQKFLSYSAGWMSTLGWLASVSSSVFVMTTQIQSIIEITKSEFSFTSWQYTLIMLGFLLITIIFNTWWAKALPGLETMSLFGHLGGFLLVMIPLLVMAPKNCAKQVFTEVVNNGGWSNTGTTCLVFSSYGYLLRALDAFRDLEAFVDQGC